MIEDDRQTLLLSHRDTLGRVARRFATNAEDAEDLAQDLAIVVLAHHTGPPDAESFVGWCFGVARNLAAHKHRSDMRRRRRDEHDVALEPDAAIAPPRYDPESSAIVRESLAMKLDGLTPVTLSLLRDRYVFEETSEEIAARLQISSASVRMRLARLLAMLRVVEGDP